MIVVIGQEPSVAKPLFRHDALSIKPRAHRGRSSVSGVKGCIPRSAIARALICSGSRSPVCAISMIFLAIISVISSERRWTASSRSPLSLRPCRNNERLPTVGGHFPLWSERTMQSEFSDHPRSYSCRNCRIPAGNRKDRACVRRHFAGDTRNDYKVARNHRSHQRDVGSDFGYQKARWLVPLALPIVPWAMERQEEHGHADHTIFARASV